MISITLYSIIVVYIIVIMTLMMKYLGLCIAHDQQQSLSSFLSFSFHPFITAYLLFSLTTDNEGRKRGKEGDVKSITQKIITADSASASIRGMKRKKDSNALFVFNTDSVCLFVLFFTFILLLSLSLSLPSHPLCCHVCVGNTCRQEPKVRGGREA